MATKYYDVVIVGAGLSGITTAYHLQKDCPSRTYAVLESRQEMGGTWDLFRYPGIRSDSDMFTLGFHFKPYQGEHPIVSGETIKNYIIDAANENSITPHIQFGKKVLTADWSSDNSRWTLTVLDNATQKQEQIHANFVVLGTGYYRYDRGYTPDFKGADEFKGQIIHPQLWPENLDYSNKKIVVIGSGATAVTLVPSLTPKAEKVYLLQRSPTYMLSLPNFDPTLKKIREKFSAKRAYQMIRVRNQAISFAMYHFCRFQPERAKKYLIGRVQRKLGEGYDMSHFTPRYNPWDERLCMVPNGDLFKDLRAGKAEMVTDHIERFDAKGIVLKSGRHLDADIIVTATGLDLQLCGGIAATIDGQAVNVADTMSYKGVMFSTIPNFMSVFGYTNASWTLKADLAAQYATRLLNYMDQVNATKVVPINNDPTNKPVPFLDLQAGYIQRVLHVLPKQGTQGVWKLNQNYYKDMANMKYAPIDDGALVFSNHSQKLRQAPTPAKGVLSKVRQIIGA